MTRCSPEQGEFPAENTPEVANFVNLSHSFSGLLLFSDKGEELLLVKGIAFTIYKSTDTPAAFIYYPTEAKVSIYEACRR